MGFDTERTRNDFLQRTINYGFLQRITSEITSKKQQIRNQKRNRERVDFHRNSIKMMRLHLLLENMSNSKEIREKEIWGTENFTSILEAGQRFQSKTTLNDKAKAVLKRDKIKRVLSQYFFTTNVYFLRENVFTRGIYMSYTENCKIF